MATRLNDFYVYDTVTLALTGGQSDNLVCNSQDMIISSVDASHIITGIDSEGANQVGTYIELFNSDDTNVLVLEHLSVDSDVANRFITPDGLDYTVAGYGYMYAKYRDIGGVKGRWIL